MRSHERLRGDRESVGAGLGAPAHLLQLARPAAKLGDGPAERGECGPRSFRAGLLSDEPLGPAGGFGQGLERTEQPLQERRDEKREEDRPGRDRDGEDVHHPLRRSATEWRRRGLGEPGRPRPRESRPPAQGSPRCVSA